ncbi:MAG: phosphogluconate dehydratase [Acidobacteria bacterium]|nr:phosphogluconate dehydratase [Acidobacteriota bacterium]
MLHPKIAEITETIVRRSEHSRTSYLKKIREARSQKPKRVHLSCGNLAHGFAACAPDAKGLLAGDQAPNLAIVSAYNDMLSAHQPLRDYPEWIKRAIEPVGAVAQFAGGVPAMCDGVTQGQPGMELSLFSRDVIAMATAVALSHDMFDGTLCLGVCDKIVPGLMLGALSFGHLPTLFVPAGPMPSGLPNADKARIRQLYAEGKVGRAELLEAESASYHGPGTCTFYGTANTNQMLMELMGLHLPGASFVNPGTDLRRALTEQAGLQLVALVRQQAPGIGEMLDEKSFVNGIVGLLATGGSTNLTIHLLAIARAAGILLDWQDFSELSAVVPLLARVYPNGQADVNHLVAAGGLGFIIRELLAAGLLHEDVTTVMGKGLDSYCQEPFLERNKLTYRPGLSESADLQVLRPHAQPFQVDGGLKMLHGNLGKAVIKRSAVKPQHLRVHAPARVFDSQDDFLAAFKQNALTGDLVAVVRFQGPKANGMPELHKLTPALGVLQDRGQSVALVTDGRMSGASGKVPAAIHLCPETVEGGALARVNDGDWILLDAEQGVLEIQVSEAVWASREAAECDLSSVHSGCGRELFAGFRHLVSSADSGASVLFHEEVSK